MQIDKLYDKRTVGRNIGKSLVTQKDYDKYRDGQEDCADTPDVIELDTELDDMPRAKEYKD
ncbi:MAG: hypothetical protein V1647_03965 [Pseudomonadota bacterium]